MDIIMEKKFHRRCPAAANSVAATAECSRNMQVGMSADHRERRVLSDMISLPSREAPAWTMANKDWRTMHATLNLI